MSVQMEKLEHNMAKLTIEMAQDEFDKFVDAAYKRNKNKINIPGFRKGKVSRQIIEKMYGKEFFYGDAVNDAIADAYEKAYDECEEEIVSRPEIDIVTLEAGKPFVFTAEVALNPEAKIGEYKGVEIEKADSEVTDADVDEFINKERDEDARMTVVDRAAQNGDQVILDYEGFVDGEAFEGGKGENHPLTLGSNSIIPGFEDQVVGKKAEEEFDVNVTFPEDYHAENLKGKAAVFKCKVHEVKEKQTPELDDDFAGDKGFDTVDEYKADVREKLTARKAEAAKNKKESDVLEKLIEGAEMDIPEAMIKSQVEQSIDEYAQQLRRQGLSLDQYFMFTGLDREKMAENSRPGIEKRIKSRLVLEAVAKAEGIVASDEDYEKELTEMAEQYKLDVENIKGMIRPQDEKMMRKDIEIQKALDFVVENAKEK